MNGALTNGLIAVGIVSVIGYALKTCLQNRRRRARAGAGVGGGSSDSYASSSDGFSLGGWFSRDSSDSPTDGPSCSGGDSSGGDCGGGGDGGGGGGD